MIDQKDPHTMNDQIHQEHEEMRELLGSLHRALSKRTETVERVRELFGELSEHIESHFTNEEDGGFFDEVSTQAPRLTEQCDNIKEEHTWLLTSLRALNESAQANASDDWWTKMETDFHQFSKDLMHHENKEHELLHQAYSEDIGFGD